MGAGVMNKGGGGGSRRRRRRTSGGSKAMAEINITPFVDVMLVLLIIFMVAAPLMTVGVPVELPKTQASALPTDEEEPLTVTITAEGALLIQNTETEEGEMVAKLQAIAAERSSDRIYLRADGNNAWNHVAEVMGLLNAGGFSNIGLVTDVASPAGTDG